MILAYSLELMIRRNSPMSLRTCDNETLSAGTCFEPLYEIMIPMRISDLVRELSNSPRSAENASRISRLSLFRRTALSFLEGALKATWNASSHCCRRRYEQRSIRPSSRFPDCAIRLKRVLPRRISDFFKQLSLVAHGEFLAALRSPACKHISTVLGCHALTKTVGILAFSFVGLECSLHGNS